MNNPCVSVSQSNLKNLHKGSLLSYISKKQKLKGLFFSKSDYLSQ